VAQSIDGAVMRLLESAVTWANENEWGPGEWSYDPITSVLTCTYDVAPNAPQGKRWLITADNVTEHMCPGSGKHWGKSALFGIPHCPQCLRSWSLLGVEKEPHPTWTVPVHEYNRLRMGPL